MDINILRFDKIDSTNTEAIKQARSGAREGLCVVARQQTAGRGRQGRTWVSPPDSGLYFSIVLRPRFQPRLLPLITLMTGVAVHDALTEIEIDADIKWVNDLLVDDKKIGGILSEAVETADGLAVIIGIGLNLRSNNFPPEIAETATSIEAVTGRSISVDDVIHTLTAQVRKHYASLQNGQPADVIENWRQRSSYYSGKPVRVETDHGSFEGVTDGLEKNGALKVRTSDGQLRVVQAGDIHRLRPRTIEL